MKMQQQKQKQETMFFEFLKCKKQKAKQMFFWLFSFIKQKLEKTKHNYQNPSQNETEFQAQTSRMLPNLIRLKIARSIRVTEDQKLS